MTAGVGTAGARPGRPPSVAAAVPRPAAGPAHSACSGVLVVVLQLVRPGIVTADWLGVTLRAAVPLAILAGCQTLTC